LRSPGRHAAERRRDGPRMEGKDRTRSVRKESPQRTGSHAAGRERQEKMNRVFITGGAGFIGSYVARELLAEGREVALFDSFVSYVSPLEVDYHRYLKERLKGIEEKVVILRGDTTNLSDVRRAVSRYRPEVIIHLAALPIADLSNRYSEEAVKSIIQGAVNVLETIRDTDTVQRFVYVSSSMIYGDFQHVPAGEEHPKKPKDIYGGTKLAGEILTEAFGRRFGIEYVIVRPSAVYGPTDVNRRVTQIFLESAMAGKPLVLHNGGASELDFTYVEDTAHGMVLAAFEKNAANQVFNITRGEGRSLKELAGVLQRWFPELRTIMEKQPDDLARPKRGALDISRARDLLHYEPRYSLEEGMERYVSFMREFRKGS
jgi:UDP-glucose 4-epimerase